jgi:hypothetical protein
VELLRAHGCQFAPSDAVPTVQRVRRLRPLTEAECYARCYGAWDAGVRVVRLAPHPPLFPEAMDGELLRRLFEERLDAREQDEAEAA